MNDEDTLSMNKKTFNSNVDKEDKVQVVAQTKVTDKTQQEDDNQKNISTKEESDTKKRSKNKKTKKMPKKKSKVSFKHSQKSIKQNVISASPSKKNDHSIAEIRDSLLGPGR